MVRTTISIAFFFLFLTLVSCTNGTMGGSSATNADITNGDGSNSTGGGSGGNNQNPSVNRRFVVGQPIPVKDSSGNEVKAELSATGLNGDWYFTYDGVAVDTGKKYLALIRKGETNISAKQLLSVTLVNDYSVEKIQIGTSGKVYLLLRKQVNVAAPFYALSYLILSHDLQTVEKNGTSPVLGQFYNIGTYPPAILDRSAAQGSSGGGSETITFSVRINSEVKLFQLYYNGTDLQFILTTLTNATDLHSLDARTDAKLIAVIAPSPSPSSVPSPTPLAARVYEIEGGTQSNLGDFAIFPSAFSYKWGSFINDASFFGVSPYGGGLSVYRYSFDGVNSTLTSEDSFRITPDTTNAFYGAIPSDRAKEGFYLYRTARGLIATGTLWPNRQISSVNLSLDDRLTGFTSMDPIFQGAHTPDFNAKGEALIVLTHDGGAKTLLVPLRIEDVP